MKTIKNKKYIGLDADGEYFPIDEDKKSIILNGKKYVLPDDVWNFLLCLDSERDYYIAKFMELTMGEEIEQH